MPRMRIDMPGTYPFSCLLPVRIGDINYGGHLGNDSIVSILHESRLKYLQSMNCTELDACGAGVIMADLVITYKNEGFYGDSLVVKVAPGEITSRGFVLFYRITCQRGEIWVDIAEARTGMLCFNYDTRKVMLLPDELKNRLEGGDPNQAP